MIGLDTNVLVRYLVQDDPHQSKLASDVIDGLNESNRGFISIVALTELSWVLTRAYKINNTSLAAILHGLLTAADINVEHADEVRSTIPRLQAGADLADGLIAELGRRAGCEATLTFDRNASIRAGMQLLS